MKRLFSILILVLSSSVALSACGGGGGGGGILLLPNNGGTPKGKYSVAAAVKNTAPADVCPNGGITVQTGIDTNGNGILDPSEVQNTQYVCNGANGANGQTALVSVTNEPAGPNCAYGGQKVSVGLDANGNGILDPSEITSSDYICNGAVGTNGTNGISTLMSIVPEPDGSNCAYGGQKIASGLDADNNGVLDPSEVTSTEYVCNGAPGPGITWVDVTGTSIQAVSNSGYMADSASQVTITLPASPAMGDIVQVTGVGTGGWKIAQNAGQCIITKDLTNSISAAWTLTSAPTAQWRSVASSSDGTKLVASAAGEIYTSSDSGGTWTLTSAPFDDWLSVASSSDGTKLVAIGYLTGINTSSNSGVTWTDRGLHANSVASSADGVKLVAVQNLGYGGLINTSSDSGVNWTWQSSAPSTPWTSVASSSDGTKLVATSNNGAYTGGIYTSSDSGSSWTLTSAPTANWVSVASSIDGTKLVAAVINGQIYTSTDSGATWTPRDSTRYWASVASSIDGTRLVAAAYSGGIYTSSNSGVAWTLTSAPPADWTSVASSSDGTELVAAVYGGGIYVRSGLTAVPRTTVGTAGSISGGQYDAVELQYIGNNTFMVLSSEGVLVVQ